MRRLFWPLEFVAGFALAGLLSGIVIAVTLIGTREERKP